MTDQLAPSPDPLISTEPTMPTSPPPAAPSNKKYFFLSFFITLFCVALLSLALYLYRQNISLKSELASTPTPTPVSSPDPTADWQTVANENKFSFQYPNNFTKKDFSTTELLLTADDNVHQFRINVFKKPPTKSIQAFVYEGAMGKNYGKEYQDQGSNYKVTFELVFEKTGIKVWQPSDNFPSGAGTYLRLIEYADNLIWFSLEPYNNSGTLIPSQDKYVDIFDQILSTFKFTE